MNAGDMMRTIRRANAVGPATLRLVWSDGRKADVDLTPLLDRSAFKRLRNGSEFEGVRVGEWGHSVEWPTGAEVGADWLWLQTLSATGHDDARQFLTWRYKHGLSLSEAAEALGLSRRMVAYYSNGEKPVPRHILLACLGWEVREQGSRASNVQGVQTQERLPEPAH